jgi:glycosyltransferase involved in cell wall biosynthesis
MHIYEKAVDFFIAPSNFMKRKMIEFAMPTEKFVHIPNFIHTDLYRPNYAYSDYFLYLGRLSREKGLPTLLRAMGKINSIRLHIAGEGPARADLEKICSERMLDNVKFLGHLSGERLSSAVRAASFLVLPSECYENAPMSVLEAFAYGKPVLGARIGGVPELIDDGRDGLLFESGNVDDLAEKIRYIISHKDKLPEMGKRAREKIEEKYHSALYYKRLMDVYDKALSKRSNKQRSYR